MTLVIDIGSKYIHFIQEKNKMNIKCSSILVPQGSISNGEIVSIDGLTQAVKQELKKKGYRKKHVTFLIHSSEIVVKEAELPKVKPKEMLFLLEQELMGLISGEDHYLVDYKVIEAISESTHKVMIIAMPKTLVASYRKLAQAIGARKWNIDLYQNSISKLIENQKIKEEQPMILADIGNSMLHLHLFDGYERVFSRSIFINTEQYKDTLILMGQLKDDEAFLNLDLSVNSLQENQILFNLMSPYLASISSEIQNMLQFQLGRNSKNPVYKVYIYGGMSHMKGLAQYLESELLIPVKDIHDLGIGFETKALNQYVAGLGEIYPDVEKGIDFYKVYKQVEKNDKKLSKTTLVGGFVLAGQVIIGGSLGAYILLSASQNNQLAEQIIFPYTQPTMAEKLKVLDTMSKEAEHLKQQIAQLEQSASEIESMPKLDQNFWKQLAQKMPTSLVFNNLSYQSGSISISCEVYSEQEILDFVHALRQLESVQEVSYTGYTLEAPIYQFNVQIVLKGGTD